MGGHFEVVILDANLRFASEEFGAGAVVSYSPAGTLSLNVDPSQWIENFKQAHILMSLAVDDRKGVVGHIGIDRNMLIIGGIAGKKNAKKQHKSRQHPGEVPAVAKFGGDRDEVVEIFHEAWVKPFKHAKLIS